MTLAGRPISARRRSIKPSIIATYPQNTPISIWSSVLRPITELIARAVDGDARQLGGVVDQRIEREIDPGRDDPALVGAVEVDHVERGRGAEVDHDQVARDAARARRWR